MKTRTWNRREFLTATTLSAAALATDCPPLGAAETTPAQKRPISIGFLGAVYSHAADKLSVLRASKDYNLVGVCDDDGTVRRGCETQGIKLLSQAELLHESDVIAVESAVRDHARHARLALEAGKHIHLEKPQLEKMVNKIFKNFPP